MNYHNFKKYKSVGLNFSGDAVARNLPANAGNVCSIPGAGRFHMPSSHNY